MFPASGRVACISGLVCTLAACSGGGGSEPAPLAFVAATFNTGTSEEMGHDDPPDDGYTSAHAAISDQYYGDGLAWRPAVEAARIFLDEVRPDVIGFQEIFYSDWCADIPPAAVTDFVCEIWQPGDPTVARVILGADYQIMCNPGYPDKCAAVRKDFGSFAGCEEDFCLEGMTGYPIEGCGSRGARLGRARIELAAGGELTLVALHGTSGMSADDYACRVEQIEQIFVDLGDGEPGANGQRNLILGDFNTDPGRMTDWDDSAVRWNDFVGDDQPFHFVTRVGDDAPGSYLGMFDIDHVVSDTFDGDCWRAGLEGHPQVIEARYFDHMPVVCSISENE